MRAHVDFPQQFEFAISSSNQILVENHAEEVIIRAARDTLSSREKLFIIRHLAMEGFIPERYQWFTALHSLREWSHIPVLVLSERMDDEVKVAALDAGD